VLNDSRKAVLRGCVAAQLERALSPHLPVGVLLIKHKAHALSLDQRGVPLNAVNGPVLVHYLFGLQPLRASARHVAW